VLDEIGVGKKEKRRSALFEIDFILAVDVGQFLCSKSLIQMSNQNEQ
jgi:hypothetical protein